MSFRPFQPFRGFGGGSAPWSPLSLSPSLWLDASDAATLYDATSGGSLVAADGTVARIEDKSGNIRHATQATSGKRPLRKTGVQNGLGAIQFDESDDGLDMPALALGVNFSAVFVIKDTGVKGTGFMIMGGGPFQSGADYKGYFWQSRSNLTTYVRLDGEIEGCSYSNFGPANAVILWEVHRAGAAIESYVNGVRVGSTILSNATAALTLRTVGWSYQAQNYTMGGLLGEIVLVNAPVSGADRSKLRQSLATKWGISVA